MKSALNLDAWLKLVGSLIAFILLVDEAMVEK